jgi:hypothetical protein
LPVCRSSISISRAAVVAARGMLDGVSAMRKPMAKNSDALMFVLGHKLPMARRAGADLTEVFDIAELHADLHPRRLPRMPPKRSRI